MCFWKFLLFFYLYIIFPNDKLSCVWFINNDFGGFLSLCCLFTSPRYLSRLYTFSSSIYPYFAFFIPANLSFEVSFLPSWGPFSPFLAFVNVYSHLDTITEDGTYVWRECTVWGFPSWLTSLNVMFFRVINFYFKFQNCIFISGWIKSHWIDKSHFHY